MQYGNRIYLFVHVIWSTSQGAALLTRPVRKVLFAHMKSHAEGKMIRILVIDGVEDHLHCLLQLHPLQTLSKVVKDLREDAAQWINENRIVDKEFGWEESYVAYSVSPSAVRQVWEYIEKQEEHHKTKSLESELEVFGKIPF